MTASLRAGACLSLSGKFAPFGRQAANGLKLWADHAGAELTVLDDQSERGVLIERLPGLASQVDLLFGPYSTKLIHPAIQIAGGTGRLLFNHGGSGGTLNAPGRVVNMLTPARRYAAPFVEMLGDFPPAPLHVTSPRGSFGKDVIAGGVEAARAAQLVVDVFDADSPPADGPWDLLSAGVYEDDVAVVRTARALANPPRFLCSVAAGVAQFARDVDDSEGVLGIGQWVPGATATTNLGMTESEFLGAWSTQFGGVPDYPAVQAYAAGVVAATAAESVGIEAAALWRELATLDVQTVFGRFHLNPETGEQVGHESVLTEWRHGQQTALGQ